MYYIIAFFILAILFASRNWILKYFVSRKKKYKTNENSEQKLDFFYPSGVKRSFSITINMEETGDGSVKFSIDKLK